MKIKYQFYSMFILTCLLFSIIPMNLSAQKLSATSLKFGFFNPKDATSGLIFGINYGYIIDETIDVGFSVDFFRKSYQKDTEIAKTVKAQDITEVTKQRDMEFTTIILPLMATSNIRIPVSRISPVFLVINGGLGWEMMFNTEQNYIQDKKESRFYHGFGYTINIGMMYQIGSRSAVFGELGYNGCKVSRNYNVEEGTPIWDEVNISGLMFKVGLRLGII
jgi:hypothetical protein